MQSLVVTHDLEDFAYRPPNTWMGLPSHTATACAWLLAEMTALVGACASEYVARTQDGRADRSHHGNRLVLALAWTVVTFAAIRAALTDMGTCATTTTTLVKLLLYLQLALNPLRSAVLGAYPNPNAAGTPTFHIAMAVVYSVLLVFIYRYHNSVGDSLVRRFSASGRRAAIMALGSIFVLSNFRLDPPPNIFPATKSRNTSSKPPPHLQTVGFAAPHMTRALLF